MRDFGNLDRCFDIITPHIIPFYKFWDLLPLPLLLLLLLLDLDVQGVLMCRHDGIIFRWRHNSPSGEKLNLTTLVEIRVTLIAISPYLGAKFDYGYFIIFLRLGSTILHKKCQVIPSKIEGVTAIFPIFDVNFPDSNRRHAFIFARNDLKFFV